MKFLNQIVLFTLFALALISFGWCLYYWDHDGTSCLWSFLSFALTLLLGYHCIELFVHSPNSANRKLLISSLLIGVILVELVLRFFVSSLRSYGERNGSFYYTSATSIYLRGCKECSGTDFFINDPNTSQFKNGNEFNYLHRYDKYGLRNDSIPEKKDSNEVCIIGIGDSFTEGVGAPADSTWVKILAHLCNESGLNIRTINAGVQGSDLIFSLHLLKNCLLKYKPDVVILNLNSTDINDILARGGMDRFDTEGHFHVRKAPPLEFMFGSSFLVRFFLLHYLGYNWQVITNEQQKQEEKLSFQAIADAIKEYQALSKANNFKFILVLQPLSHELMNGNVFKDLVVDTTVSKVDLYPAFYQKIVVNKEAASDYYWTIDGHFKSKGYELMAKEIYKAEFLAK